jgi:hypothetical protein
MVLHVAVSRRFSMKEVTKEEFKDAFIRFRKQIGKPYEEDWNSKFEFADRNDIRYFLDTTEEEEDSGIVTQRLLKNDNRMILKFLKKEAIDEVMEIIQAAMDEK